jgi:hypothetical protein
MKKFNPTARLASKLLLALFIGTLGFNAAACSRFNVPCKIREAADRVKNAAEDAANKARQEAEAAANAAKQEADRAAAAAAQAAQAAAQAEAAAQAAATAAANRVAQQGSAISSTEMRTIVSGAKGVYADSTGAMTNGYNTAVNKFKALLNAALDAIWRAAGKAAVNKSGRFLLDMKHRAQNLDANGQAALNRIKRAIGSKNIDEQARADMQVLTRAIVFGGNDIASAVTHSSFGIQICDSVGAGNVGGETCYMMIMQTYLENGKFKVGQARSFGVAASPVPSDLGAESTYGIFWGPGGIDDNTGASIGLALGVVLEEGLEVGISWGIPTAIPDPSAVVPGFSVSIGAGAKGEAALSAGYTQVLAKF